MFACFPYEHQRGKQGGVITLNFSDDENNFAWFIYFSVENEKKTNKQDFKFLAGIVIFITLSVKSSLHQHNLEMRIKTFINLNTNFHFSY